MGCLWVPRLAHGTVGWIPGSGEPRVHSGWEIINTRFTDNEEGYYYYDRAVREQHGNKTHAASPCWVLMTRTVLPGSRRVSYGLRQEEVANYSSEGYSLPHILEATTGVLTHYVCTSERLLADDPWTYIRCAESVHDDDGSWPTFIGGFGATGLRVNRSIHISSLGVSCCRKL